jgi:hypothetical protein
MTQLSFGCMFKMDHLQAVSSCIGVGMAVYVGMGMMHLAMKLSGQIGKRRGQEQEWAGVDSNGGGV